jgi:hypothetical protein
MNVLFIVHKTIELIEHLTSRKSAYYLIHCSYLVALLLY